MVSDRPQPPLTRQTAPTAFAIRNIADRKARGRLRSAATAEAIGAEMEWVDSDGWRYQLEAPPVVTVSPKDIERAAATVDLRVWDATNALIFRDRIHAWDGFPVLVPDGTQHEDDDGHGGKVRVSNFRESPVEAARIDLAHTVRVVTKNGPWVKDKPGTVSTFYGTELDNYRVESNSTVYATALSGAGLSTSSFQTQAFGQRLDGATYSLHQCFEEFDTSTIGSDTISDAVLSIYINGDLSDTDFTAQARTYDHGGSISTADWRTAAQLGALTLLATLASSGVTTSAYNSFTASGTNLIDGINTGGATRLLYTSDRQVSQTAPTGQERLQYASADTAGTTQDPKLVVTHAAATKPFRRSLLGVGY